MPKDDDLDDYPPILEQNGSNDTVSCVYDEDFLLGYVDFTHVVIYFDYLGYFIENADSVASVEEVQHNIFKSLGEHTNLLKKIPKSAPDTPLQASDVSCMGLLGDFNVTKKVPGLHKPHPKPPKKHRYAKGKLKSDIFLLGLSSLPLDQVVKLNDEEIGQNDDGGCEWKLPPKDKKKLPENAFCRTVHAAVTAYIAIAGNGTIVDPQILSTSTAKYLKDGMKKDKFVTDSIPHMTFLELKLQPSMNMGFSETMISPVNQINTDNTNNGNEQSTPDKAMSQMGWYFISLFGMAILGVLFVLGRRVKERKKSTKQDLDEESKNSSDGFSPICSEFQQNGSTPCIGVQNYLTYFKKSISDDENCFDSQKSEYQMDGKMKSNESFSSEDTFSDEGGASDVVSVASQKVEVKASKSLLCCDLY